jgi:hypothetical protein
MILDCIYVFYRQVSTSNNKSIPNINPDMLIASKKVKLSLCLTT